MTKKFFSLGYDGDYGGDAYERELADELSLRFDQEVTRVTAPRRGGVLTIASLFSLLLKTIRRDKSLIIRPFGMPIYSDNMTVILHHYDHESMPWYARFIETFDLFILKFVRRFIKVNYIVVSDYWRQWVLRHMAVAPYLLPNVVVEPAVDSRLDRGYLARTYSLDDKKKWVFLGSGAAKKGGKSLVRSLNESNRTDIFTTFEFVCTGSSPARERVDNLREICLPQVEYGAFLRQCDLVVANSLFREGWCRVLHEAALLGVPGVGSGRGGMGELLQLTTGRRSYSQDEVISLLSSGVFPRPQAQRLSSMSALRTVELQRWLREL